MKLFFQLLVLALSTTGCSRIGATPTPPVYADSFFFGDAFIDANGNRTLDASDPPLRGARFVVTDGRGAFASGVTDARGHAMAWFPAPGTFPITYRMEPPPNSSYTLITSQAVVRRGYTETVETRFLFAPPTTPTRAISIKMGDYEQSLAHAGRTRTYTIYLPPNIATASSLALVIVLHGGGGNGQSVARMSRMSALADQENFIVVYPDGTGRLGDVLLTWNSGNCCGYALDNNVDDVGFIRALIEKLQAEYNVDPKRIFVTGISNGGMMAYRLGCELADKLAAIAPIAGALNVECRPTQPVSVIVFHGTADQHVLFDGGAPKVQADPHPREDNSVAYAMNFWAQHNRCEATPTRIERGNIVHDTYTNCANGTAVELYAIKGEGHTWPGGQRSSALGDAPTQEISATNVMWEFFKQHPKK